MQGRDDERANPSMLDKIDLILDSVEEAGFLNLSQVMEKTGLARSTAHRLLTDMERRRWLTRVGTNYELGVRLFRLGTRGIRNHWFYRRVLPNLNWLHAHTGHVVHLTYLDEGEAVFWERIGGGPRADAMPSRVGQRLPANATAAGKALLAGLPESLRDRMGELPAVTGRTVHTWEGLDEEFAAIARRGFATDVGGAWDGIGCLAVTVGAGAEDAKDAYRTTAAISICAPLSAIDTRLVAPLLAARDRTAEAIRVNPMEDPGGTD